MVKGQSWRAYAVAFAIFVLGAVAGAGVSHALSERTHRELAAGSFEGFERRKLGALTRKLDLSGEQKEQLRAILREDREARRKLTEEVFERCGEPLSSHRDKADERIRAVLSPEQQQRFDELVRDHRHDSFRGPPARGGQRR